MATFRYLARETQTLPTILMKKSKKKKKKVRNPHAISAGGRKSSIIRPRKDKRKNGTNKQAEYLQEATESE